MVTMVCVGSDGVCAAPNVALPGIDQLCLLELAFGFRA
jgi:hypothetical protein